MGRSRRELLKGTLAARTADRDAPVISGPAHLAPHQRMSDEGAEPLPDRRLERMAELVPAGPPLDLDQLLALEAQKRDPVDATADSGPPVKRDDGETRAPALELLPDCRPPDQLPPRRAQARAVHARSAPAGRGGAALARLRLAGRTLPLAPTASDVEMRQRLNPGAAGTTPAPPTASRARSSVTLRTPLR